MTIYHIKICGDDKPSRKIPLDQQNQEVVLYKFPLLNHHVGRHCLHPTDRGGNIKKQLWLKII